MSSNADCFVVLPANCASGCLIFGRNAEDANAVGGVGVASEICYYDVSDVLEGKVRKKMKATKMTHCEYMKTFNIFRLMAALPWSQVAKPYE